MIASAQVTAGNQRYRFRQAVALPETDATGKAVANAATATVPMSAEFNVVAVTTTGDYVIHIPTWKVRGGSAQEALFKTRNSTLSVDANGAERYFLLGRGNFTSWAELVEPRGRFVVYTSTNLIKMRPGSKALSDGYPVYFDFKSDFNLGLMAGGRFSSKTRKNVAFNVLAGIGLSSVSVDSLSTHGKVKTAGNQAALSPSLALVGEVDRFQFGASVGIDIMAGEVGRQWVYRGRPWIGIGIGFSLFQSAPSSTGQQ
ncbi:hypothetical protein GCM10028786_24740 [Flaviaesturariibacter terrae]